MRPRCLSGNRRWCWGRARATGRSLSTLSNRGQDHGYAMAVPGRPSGGVPVSMHRQWQVTPCLSSCSPGFPRFCSVQAVHHGCFSGRVITKQYHSAALTEATRHITVCTLAMSIQYRHHGLAISSVNKLASDTQACQGGKKTDRRATGQTNSTHTHMHMHMQ